MLTALNNPPAPTAPHITDEPATLRLFAPNGGLEKLMPAERARRFADLQTSLRAAKAHHHARPIASRSPSAGRATTPLREATKHYERHVLAWYALGRHTEARSAHQAIVQYRQALAPIPTPHAPEPDDRNATVAEPRPRPTIAANDESTALNPLDTPSPQTPTPLRRAKRVPGRWSART